MAAAAKRCLSVSWARVEPTNAAEKRWLVQLSFIETEISPCTHLSKLQERESLSAKHPLYVIKDTSGVNITKASSKKIFHFIAGWSIHCCAIVENFLQLRNT
jgi:hypothetical protein